MREVTGSALPSGDLPGVRQPSHLQRLWGLWKMREEGSKSIMMKYKASMWMMMAWLLKKPMSNHFGKEFAADVLKKAKPVYRRMLTETEDIGANNPMSSNIYMGFVFLAVWQAADGKINLEEYRQTVIDFMRQPMIQKVMGGNNINKPKDMTKLAAMLHKNADWIKEHPEYEQISWDFNFDETKHRDGFYYHFTRCPMEKYAREHDLLDVLPVCCDIDYESARLYHAKLHREQTLATGGEICDYWFVPDKMKDPK